MTEPGPPVELTHAPRGVHQLVSGLTASGFTVASDTGDSSVNRLLHLTGPGCAVRVIADRGQWWIELGRPPEIGWYDTDVWAACLDHHAVAFDPSTLDQQVDFALRRRADVAVAGPAIEHCLGRTRTRRAHEHLGLRPTSSEGID